MPATISHNLSATTPDNPAYEIRPSHWNSAHAVTFNAVGSEISGAFSNANNVTFGLETNGFITASASLAGGAGDGFNRIAAGTQTAGTLATVIFSNSNGITFGMSDSSVVTASHNGITSQTVQTQNMVSVLGSTGNISFANSNGITFGANASTITASHNGLTSQSNQAFSAQGGSSAFQTLSFANSNGITFSNSNGSVVASHNALTTARASNDAIGLNTAQTNVTWTVNSSGLSLNAAGYAGTATTFNGTNASGSMTLNSNGLRLDLSVAGGGLTPVASASNGSFSFTTLAFSNANNVTFGTSAGSIITASVAAPGAAAENNWINLLGANTAGNTTASGSTLGYSGINLTLSGTNGSIVNFSAPATSSLVAAADISISTNGSTITLSRTQQRASFYNPFAMFQTTSSAIGNGSLMIQPMFGFRGVESITRFDVFESMSISSSSNSSHAGALSFYLGLYTLNGSTLSLASSGSQSYQWSNTSNNSLASLSGIRRFSIPLTLDVSNGGGDVWMGLMIRSSTTNANWFTHTPLRVTNMTSLIQGLIGEASNQTKQLNLGFGLWSTTSTNLPASVAITAIRGIGTGVANNALPFMVIGANGTV
jgi:hypothetical protein